MYGGYIGGGRVGEWGAILDAPSSRDDGVSKISTLPLPLRQHQSSTCNNRDLCRGSDMVIEVLVYSM